VKLRGKTRAAIATLFLLVVAPAPIGAALDNLVGICPWNGEQGSLEIHQSNTAEGWANVRCAGGAAFCSDPLTNCTATLTDGLTYMAFVTEEAGGFIRWNQSSSYNAVVVLHRGSGGTTWPDQVRDIAGTIDWQDLQDSSGYRVVAVRWLASTITTPGRGDAGWFTRRSAAGTDLETLSKRPASVLDKIYTLLNPTDQPFGVVGASGGAHAVATPVTIWSDQALTADKIDYIGSVSGSVFYDVQGQCNWSYPPGTAVDIHDGSLGTSGSSRGFKQSAAQLVDYFLGTAPQCENRTMGPTPTSSPQALIDPADRFLGTFHAYIATGTPNSDDTENTVAWAVGNLYDNPLWDESRKVWDNCTSSGHATPLTQITTPCFQRIYDELKLTLTCDPAAPDLCNGLDDDCSGVPDDTTCDAYDADASGRVDGVELSWLGRAYTQCNPTPGTPLWWSGIDYNGDNCVDGEDLAILASTAVFGCNVGVDLCP
jgi:hypothetical protein